MTAARRLFQQLHARGSVQIYRVSFVGIDVYFQFDVVARAKCAVAGCRPGQAFGFRRGARLFGKGCFGGDAGVLGLAAPAAMSSSSFVVGAGVMLSTFFGMAAMVYGLVALFTAFNSMLHYGTAKEAAPTLMIVIPILTTLGIMMLRKEMKESVKTYWEDFRKEHKDEA